MHPFWAFVSGEVPGAWGWEGHARQSAPQGHSDARKAGPWSRSRVHTQRGLLHGTHSWPGTRSPRGAALSGLDTSSRSPLLPSAICLLCSAKTKLRSDPGLACGRATIWPLNGPQDVNGAALGVCGSLIRAAASSPCRWALPGRHGWRNKGARPRFSFLVPQPPPRGLAVCVWGGGAQEQVSRGSLSPDAMAIERKSGQDQDEGNHLL